MAYGTVIAKRVQGFCAELRAVAICNAYRQVRLDSHAALGSELLLGCLGAARYDDYLSFAQLKTTN